ncbi:MAG: phosphatase PAP2 family protein [Chloroflexi bacterium]|nr:phosphatase PAP2 family protein [Chloroflexota bacterium]
MKLRNLLGLSAVLVFVGLAQIIWRNHEPFWDRSLMLEIHQHQAAWLDTVMKGITLTGSGYCVDLVAFGVAMWLWWKGQGHKLQAFILLITVVGLRIGNGWLKQLFERPRPEVFPPLTTAGGYSFPSGHTMNAMAFYGLVAVWLWRTHYRGWAIVAGAWVVMVAISRVYLGVHYPSDVIGAIAFGAIWIVVVTTGQDMWQKRNNEGKD